MKKAVCVILAVLFLSGCSSRQANKAETENAGKQRIIGVWISCYELYGMLDSGDFKSEFSVAAKKLSLINATDAFVHVRAFGDSLFKSDYYPQSERTKRYDFDVLKFMINELSSYNIRFHAWINPFRAEDGSFNNPEDKEVRRNILSGIREIVGGYKVSGVHFDDYFYPSSDGNLDAQSFSAYSQEAQTAVDIGDYRRSVITGFVFSAKNAVKHIDPNVIFSISPAADINKNKTQSFADVEYWCKSGAADWIIPQLYFGFDYPDNEFKFENLLFKWRSISRAQGVKLIIGLAPYKLGTDIAPDSAEWKDGDDILARQVSICDSLNDISGVSFFSYSSLFCEDELHKASLSKILKASGA